MKQKRIYSLDLIKIISSILIIFHHYQQAFQVSFANFNFWDGPIYFGYLVELFFMISGYVLVANNNSSNDSFLIYIFKKIIRIYPMAIVSVTASYLICYLFNKYTGNMIVNSLDVKLYISNCLLFFDNGIFGYRFLPFNNPLWYLNDLMILYIVYFFEKKVSVLIKKDLNVVFLFVLIVYVCVSIFGINIFIFNQHLARCIVSFNIGCLLVDINSRMKNTNICMYSFISMVIVCILFFIDTNSIARNLANIAVFIFYPSLILFCINSKFMNTITKHKLFGELGKISFESYIWHSPIFYLFMGLNSNFNNFPINERWFMFLLAFIIVIWSTLMYYCVERPITNKLICKFNLKKNY